MTDSSTVMRNGPWMRGPFTVIPNTCLQDYTLSLAAHAVLVRVLSLPPNWTFHKSWAQKQYGIGRDKLDSIIRELVKAEYVLFERTRNEDGTMGGSCFTFTAFKGVFHQNTENPVVVEKTAENHTLKTPQQVKPAANNNLKKELEKAYSADASDTRTSPKASGIPSPARQEFGALAAQRPKEGASSDADASAEAMRERIHSALKETARKLRTPNTPEPGTGRAAELAGRRVAR